MKNKQQGPKGTSHDFLKSYSRCLFSLLNFQTKLYSRCLIMKKKPRKYRQNEYHLMNNIKCSTSSSFKVLLSYSFKNALI